MRVCVIGSVLCKTNITLYLNIAFSMYVSKVDWAVKPQQKQTVHTLRYFVHNICLDDSRLTKT